MSSHSFMDLMKEFYRKKSRIPHFEIAFLFLDYRFFFLFFFLRHESNVSNLLIKNPSYQWIDGPLNRNVAHTLHRLYKYKVSLKA